jgi:methionyl-tRNA formyltransferase
MGTPDFGVPALKALCAAGYPIPLVVTQPDRPKGRGRKPAVSPIKEAAKDLGLSVYQPTSLRSEEAKKRISETSPAFIVVIAFGQILPKPILDIPRYGAVNVHASLLPKYRGAAPIQWAVVNREKETGVTTMLMDEGLDTGDILLSERTKIEKNDTAATLHDRLSAMGADLIVKTLNGLETGKVSPVSQDPNIASYAPMLKKRDGRIDWQKSPEELEAFVRGMNPWPGAFATIDGRRLRIFRLASAQRTEDRAPGTVIKGFPDELRVAAGRGAVSLIEVQGESGKRMPIADFLRGKPIDRGKVLGKE